MIESTTSPENEAGIEEKVPVIEDMTTEPGDDMMLLPSGEALSLEEGLFIAGREPSRFVVLLGDIGSGKTTLVTSMYQMFLKSCSVGDLSFAGSKTLVAFERRSLYTRTTSYSPRPDTLRTPQGVRDVLHLKLRKKSRRREINLLLSDFSGEEYRSAIGDPRTAKETFPQVLEARCIILLVDGKKLATVRSRASEIQRSVHMLKTFYDGGLIDNAAQIFVTISKYDLIYPLPKDDSEQINTMLETAVKNHFPELIDRISFLKTAAMPKNEELLKPFFGLSKLLECLLADRKNTMDDYPTIRAVSQFDLWAERTGT